MENEKRPDEHHPSYGMISVSRISGGNQDTLFGSSLDSHYTSFRIRIRGGYINNNMGHMRYAADQKDPVVEIALSAAQFSELITNMSSFDGVPCTILSREGCRIERPPVQTTERKSIRDDFELKIKNLFSRLEEFQSQTEEILNKPSILKSDRSELRSKLSQFRREIESNIPFMTEMFDEATDKTINAAKLEIDNFMTNTLVTLGLEKLENNLIENTIQVQALPESCDL